ncbi:hypothetical protein PanWU01x14_171310, partial [Parasponia andersonii]
MSPRAAGGQGRIHPRLWTGSAQSNSYLDNWGVWSLEGLLSKDHRRQHTALHPDRAFNAILGRCAHWVNHPDRTT